LVKCQKIANNLASTTASIKISTADLEYLEFSDVCLTEFEKYQILLIKISNRFIVTGPGKTTYPLSANANVLSAFFLM
jgi:hypothetical protein